MDGLPAGLAGPLHILEPWLATLLRWLALGALAALAAAALWLLARRLRRLLAARRRAAPAGGPPPPPGAGIRPAVEAIRRDHRRQPREGCFRLAELLRRHLEARSPHPFTHLTAGEIAVAVGDTAVARLFDRLARLQFARRPPDLHQFEAVCDLAAEVGEGREP